MEPLQEKSAAESPGSSAIGGVSRKRCRRGWRSVPEVLEDPPVIDGVARAHRQPDRPAQAGYALPLDGSGTTDDQPSP